MANDIPAEWVKVFAATARAEVDDGAAARVARAVSPTMARFSAPDIAVPFEVEPATFITVLRRGVRP